jgi:hypothetical protein
MEVPLLGCQVRLRHDDDLSGSSVTEGVQGKFLFAGFGYGAARLISDRFGVMRFLSVWFYHRGDLSVRE